MKKLIKMCFVLVIAFVMVGCNSEENTHFNNKLIKEELNKSSRK